ncbi:hypothetical protein V1460_25760 [Streptomyces sp. SCSIO 30461]|uniref:hypothetical protein n=1 Tax=Streptomyces sp. SCSIO 30461 TaxID=3118085 RepID=UPI0030CBD36C
MSAPGLSSTQYADSTSPAVRTAAELTHALRGLPFASSGEIPVRPLVVSRRRMHARFDAARRFVSLISRTCQAAGSPEHLLELLGADPSLYGPFRPAAYEWTWADCMSRSDAVLSGGVPRFLECNIGGAIGGVVSMHVLTRHHLARLGERYAATDPLDVRAEQFADICLSLGREPAAAVLGTLREDNVGDARYFELEIAHLRRRGLDAAFFEPEDLLDGLGLPGRARYPVGLRHFLPVNWRDWGIDSTPARRAAEEGVLMLAPDSAFLLQNKKVLAWMSEGRPWFDAADRAFLDRHLPWTRVVADAPVYYRGQRADLPRILLSRRDDMVLKPADGYGGLGIVVGRATSAADWERAVDDALNGHWIAQEYVEPDAEPMEFVLPSGEAVTRTVPAVHGLLLMSGREAGCLVRQSPGTSTVLNARQGASLNIAVHPR